jgi:hypothetical protein
MSSFFFINPFKCQLIMVNMEQIGPFYFRTFSVADSREFSSYVEKCVKMKMM